VREYEYGYPLIVPETLIDLRVEGCGRESKQSGGRSSMKNMLKVTSIRGHRTCLSVRLRSVPSLSCCELNSQEYRKLDKAGFALQSVGHRVHDQILQKQRNLNLNEARLLRPRSRLSKRRRHPTRQSYTALTVVDG
jgi:hypothetical protein